MIKLVRCLNIIDEIQILHLNGKFSYFNTILCPRQTRIDFYQDKKKEKNSNIIINKLESFSYTETGIKICKVAEHANRNSGGPYI